MSTTLLRDFHRTDRELPTGVPPHRPPQAERGAEHVRPELSYEETPTYVHPAVVATAMAGYVWMLFVFWIVFAGYGYMGVSLVIATMISAVMLGLLIGCGGSARDVTPWQRPWRSFQVFLSGEVEVWGGRMSGREAFIQLAGMSWCLAALATAFAITIALSRP